MSQKSKPSSMAPIEALDDAARERLRQKAVQNMTPDSAPTKREYDDGDDSDCSDSTNGKRMKGGSNDDPIETRRERNRQAAARSRQKRQETIARLTEETDKQKAENDALRRQIEAKKKELQTLKQNFDGHNCQISKATVA